METSRTFVVVVQTQPTCYNIAQKLTHTQTSPRKCKIWTASTHCINVSILLAVLYCSFVRHRLGKLSQKYTGSIWMTNDEVCQWKVLERGRRRSYKGYELRMNSIQGTKWIFQEHLSRKKVWKRIYCGPEKTEIRRAPSWEFPSGSHLLVPSSISAPVRAWVTVGSRPPDEHWLPFLSVAAGWRQRQSSSGVSWGQSAESSW